VRERLERELEFPNTAEDQCVEEYATKFHNWMVFGTAFFERGTGFLYWVHRSRVDGHSTELCWHHGEPEYYRFLPNE
jgi:hypothetical protein